MTGPLSPRSWWSEPAQAPHQDEEDSAPQCSSVIRHPAFRSARMCHRFVTAPRGTGQHEEVSARTNLQLTGLRQFTTDACGRLQAPEDRKVGGFDPAPGHHRPLPPSPPTWPFDCLGVPSRGRTSADVCVRKPRGSRPRAANCAEAVRKPSGPNVAGLGGLRGCSPT
jgi:hypothetical protein